MSENAELFTTRMRKATRKIHSVSDALINAKFALSYKDETVWAGGLFVFYHIFGYLEDTKDRLNMPDFNKLFVHTILHRKKAFEEDLQHYLGEDWRRLSKSEALENYLEHLQGLETETPQLLMAYVYHLYLGLLSGGQILARRKSRREGDITDNKYRDKVTDLCGVDIGELKKEFRQAMNEIADKMTQDEQQAFIDESNRVFVLNNMIVNSVEGQNEVIKKLLYKASAVVLVVVGAVLAYKLH